MVTTLKIIWTSYVMRLKQVIEVSHGIIGRLTSLTSIISCFSGYDWYLWKKRTTCSEMSLLRRGHTHQKRSSRAQIRSMPMQLFTYLQKHQRPHRVSSTQLPACHQLSPVRATPTAHAHRAGHVPSHLRSLSWQFSGKSYRLKKIVKSNGLPLYLAALYFNLTNFFV